MITSLAPQSPNPLATLRGAKGAIGPLSPDGKRGPRGELLLFLLLLWLVIAPASLQAADTVRLSLDRTEAMLGDVVQLSVSIEGGEPSQPPQIAGLEAFHVSTGGTSSQVQIINGRMSRSFEYTYAIEPTRKGVFTIGPARITFKGQTVASNTVQLAVSSQPSAATETGKGPLFLTAVLSSQETYLEQQLVYTLKLYRQIKVANVSADLPDAEGLTFKQLGDPKEYVSTLNGQSYQVLEVSYLLTPSRTGTFKLAPARMHMAAFEPSRRAPRGFFDDSFFGMAQGRSVNVPSEPITLTVRQLPQAGRPADFSGLVGAFRINATCDPTRLKAGDSASLTVLVTGQGNLNRIPDLTLPDIPDLKVYPDKPQLESSIGAQGATGTKTMKWAIVPQKQGAYEIPALTLSYFDTETKGYRSLSTQPLRLSVLPGQTQPIQTAAPAAGPPVTRKHAVEELGKDILPIHTDPQSLHPGLDLRHHLITALVVLLIPLLAWMIVLLMMRLRRQDAEQTRTRRARKALKTFTSSLDKQTPSANQMLEALRTYINDRFSLSIGIITPEEIARILSDHRVPLDVIERLQGIMSILQQAVYTGQGDQPAPHHDDLLPLIRRIDKEAS